MKWPENLQILKSEDGSNDSISGLTNNINALALNSLPKESGTLE